MLRDLNRVGLLPHELHLDQRVSNVVWHDDAIDPRFMRRVRIEDAAQPIR